MPEVRDALERVAAQVAQEPNGFDRVRARRARRDRTRRTAAIVVAVATAVAGLTLAATIWSTPSARPVQRPSPPAPSHSASTAARPAPLDLWSLRMVSATAGWATSHNDSGRFSILRTSDGAATWWDVTPPGIVGDQSGVTAFSLDRSHAWVAWPHPAGVAGTESVTVFRTSDGGRAWSRSSFTSRPSFDGTVQFVDPLHGWAVGTIGAAAGTDPVGVWRTLDGGATWESVSISGAVLPFPGAPASTPNALPPCGAAVTFVDRTTGFATTPCATGAQLYATHDAGSSWAVVSLSPPFGVVGGPDAPTFTARRDGFIPFLAPQGVAVKRIYDTHDGGTTWSLVQLPRGRLSFLSRPAFLGAARVWIFAQEDGGGREFTFATSGGGAHWTRYETSINLAGSEMQFVDPQHGWAISRIPQEPFLFRTDDGGRTWRRVTPVRGG